MKVCSRNVKVCSIAKMSNVALSRLFKVYYKLVSINYKVIITLCLDAFLCSMWHNIMYVYISILLIKYISIRCTISYSQACERIKI